MFGSAWWCACCAFAAVRCVERGIKFSALLHTTLVWVLVSINQSSRRCPVLSCIKRYLYYAVSLAEFLFNLWIRRSLCPDTMFAVLVFAKNINRQCWMNE